MKRINIEDIFKVSIMKIDLSKNQQWRYFYQSINNGDIFIKLLIMEISILRIFLSKYQWFLFFYQNINDLHILSR